MGGYIDHEMEALTAARLLLQQGQENVSDLQSMLELMRSPDISLFGRGDLLAFEQLVNSSSSSSNSTNNASSHTAATGQNGKLQKTPIDLGLYATSNHHQKNHFKGTFRDIFKKIIAAKKVKQELSENSAVNDDSNSAEDLKSEEDKQIIKVSMKNRTLLHMQRHASLFKNIKPSYAHLKDLVGLIDFKITQGQGETFFAAAGPLYSSLKGPIVIEPFQWSKSPIKDLPHNGQSDVWKFDPVEPNWVWTKPTTKVSKKNT